MDLSKNWLKTIIRSRFDSQFILLSLFVFSIPFDTGVNGILLTLTLLVAFFQYDWLMIRKDLQAYQTMFLPVLIIIVLVFGLTYSSNFLTGVSLITRRISLLLVPIYFVVASNKIVEKKEVVLKIFVFSILLVSFICYSNAIFEVYKNRSLLVPNQEREYYFFSYIFLTKPIGLDPLYLSLYVVFCLQIVLTYFRNNLLKYILYVYFVIFGVLIASKIGIIAMMVLTILHFVLKAQKKLKAIVLSILITIFFLGVITYFKPMRERIVVELDYNFADDYAGNWNSVTMRLAIWQSAIETFSNSWLWGYGTGGGNLALLDSFKDHNFIRGYEDEYNSHNEFLFLALEVGVAGALALAIMMLWSFWLGIKYDHYYMMEFILVSLLFFLVEVVLNRQKGVIFFSFFYSLGMRDLISNTMNNAKSRI